MRLKKYSQPCPKPPKKSTLAFSSKTQIFTKPITDQLAIEQSIDAAKKELRFLVHELLAGKRSFFYGKQICNGIPVDFHRVLLEWSRKSSIDWAIRNLIISSFYSTEVKQGGSGLISCLMWLNEIEILSSVRKSEIADIEKVLCSWGRSGMSYELSKKIFMIGSVGTEVSLTEGSHLGTKVTVSEGEIILGNVDNLFLTKNPDIEIVEKSFVVAIDGIVENISQIHHLLENAGRSTLIILSRGFLPDVSNTLAENYLKNRLKVVPFIVNKWGVKNFLDLENIGMSCAASSIGSDIRKIKLRKEITCNLTSNQLLYTQHTRARKRKINISFGEDLGTLRGISKDRTKILLALTRFSARSGTAKCSTPIGSFYVPNSSIEIAKKSLKSMKLILQNLGAVIISL